MKKSNYDLITDIAILGAGPAGSSTSIFLSKNKIRHIIFDKAVFPRDKICGDGLSGKVVSILKKIDPGIIHKIDQQKSEFLGSWGIRFIAPNGKGVNIPFKNETSNERHPPGFVTRRFNFDNFLVERLDPDYTDVRFSHEITNLEYNEQGILLRLKNNGREITCLAKMVVGAEGDRSLVAKKLAGQKMYRGHYYAGLRAYYENVTGMHEKNFVELHFLKEILPGYLWIFPLPNNQANVGIGMPSRDIHKKKINLKKVMLKAITENPAIKYRFMNAKLSGGIKGWGLPLGSIKRRISGDRYILTGDAASLIDPFTGEGVGNAMLSGMIAAGTVKQALHANNFSEAFLARYDEAIYQRLWDELKLSRTIQRLVRLPWLFNFVINRINKNTILQETISTMFNDLNIRAKLCSPSFYLRLLLNK